MNTLVGKRIHEIVAYEHSKGNTEVTVNQLRLQYLAQKGVCPVTGVSLDLGKFALVVWAKNTQLYTLVFTKVKEALSSIQSDDNGNTYIVEEGCRKENRDSLFITYDYRPAIFRRGRRDEKRREWVVEYEFGLPVDNYPKTGFKNLHQVLSIFSPNDYLLNWSVPYYDRIEGQTEA